MRKKPKEHNPKKSFETSRRTFIRATALSVASGACSWNFSAALRAQPAKSKSGPKGLKVQKIAPGVFVHTGVHGIYTPKNAGDISNAGFIIGDESVAVIDTGGTFQVGQALKEAIRQKTDRPIRYVINTHMHPDHVLGNAAFESDETQFVAHHKMARGLAARAKRYLAINKTNAGDKAFKGTRIVMPTHGIKSLETIDLGGRKLELDPQPTAHTDNDLVITDTKTKTLFLGDLLFSGHCPALDGSILGWLNVIDKLSKIPADRAVPGHGPASMAWPDAIIPQRRYLQTITDEVRVRIAQGDPLGEAMESVGLSEKQKWELFDDFHRRNVAAAFAELEWE